MELTDGNLSLVNVESTGGYVVAVRVIEGYLPPQLMSPSQEHTRRGSHWDRRF